MKRIAEQGHHAALVMGDHDDRARQDFAFTLRNHVTSHLMPANRLVFDKRAGPAHARATGTALADPKAIRAAMNADSWYRFYTSARRSSQELLWASVIPAVAANTAEPAAATLGSLTLDPHLIPPRYVDAIDIHCMPGGYTADRGDGDLAAGAVYDRGVYLYMSGLMGAYNDAVGQLAVGWLRRERPDFAPARILDIGCAVGHATLPWCDAFPSAEVHGIDVGAALLRYAHARAGSLGKAVHFTQANAESTPFPDGHFDLVTSSIVLHETSTRGLPAILRECHRVLKPGGLMLHVDQPKFDDSDPWATFLQENETWYNNEPFWRQYRRIDLAALAADCGFAPADIIEDTLVADVVRQSQNNSAIDAAKKKGFGLIAAVKR
ncbi:class I SAM-dependent methyltransferase [Sandaracinobacteroides saxicola]|uniref:Class I SAM-dependent methyltransferase n=1 Tax=Sandaracinobacteroides saxicola TaxID=2759707 RepID=A0A7G5IGE4_9SPHN|nr:class I SAM-dependent methyltransferase [Sandaracinobacteroides saxicola]QMW22436.1 class I SAM-dependent methyltransferase [Sandaracinobacteroides saxicola]